MNDPTTDHPFKVCRKCNISQPASVDTFYRCSDNKDGLHNFCKVCAAEHTRRWKQTPYGKERCRQNMRGYAARIKAETGISFATIYARKNPAHQKQLRANWWNKNRVTLRGTLLQLITGARSKKVRGGKERKVKTTINLDYLVELWESQEGECALTGDPMEFGVYGKRPMKVSIDQIIPMGGYIPGNVQLVCWYINKLKSDLLMDSLIEACHKIAARFPLKKIPGRKKSIAMDDRQQSLF